LVDGALWVQGRADRQVKILGDLVDGEAIEGERREHRSREVELSLLHVPDERRGWRLVPVVARGDAAIDDLVEVMNTRLPGFARLEVPHHVTELPRTALGKVDGAALREEVRRAGR
jgi:acyl-CoA synthetase (AMP-forming)/AMP-acid ligase II